MLDQILPLPALLQLPVHGMAVYKLKSHLTAEISAVWETRAMWCPKALVQTVGFLIKLFVLTLSSPHRTGCQFYINASLKGKKNSSKKCAFEIKLPLSYEYITYF